eukprot:3890790-Alexandrium_andersonii.AAC.1
MAASECSDGSQDYWERGDREWTRVHVVPRTHLFVPEEVTTGTLRNERATLVDSCGRTRTVEDRWDGVYAVRKLPHEWTG